jgi:aryl-alcohol dehydrogenase-like predicted oxidoreductase
MTLPLRPLGDSGLSLSPLGLGTWVFGGTGWRYTWGAQDDAESIATVRRAVELGVNWIDTAAVYGLGHAEEVVGRALAGIPESDRPYVFTKAGLVWDPDDLTAAPRRTMRPDSVRRELEDSLRRLGVEAIDLYQVHWPDTGAPLVWGEGAAGAAVPPTRLEEYWQTMADLKKEGKVRAIGLSNHSADELGRAAEIAPVDAVQPPLSVLNTSAAADIAWAERHRTGVIVYSPLHSGLLTGSFTAERVAALPADDWRRSHPDFTRDLAANLRAVSRLRRVADRYGVPVSAVALAWALAWPGVTGAIVGARTPGQTDYWPEAARLRLTEADLAEISGQGQAGAAR